MKKNRLSARARRELYASGGGGGGGDGDGDGAGSESANTGADTTWDNAASSVSVGDLSHGNHGDYSRAGSAAGLETVTEVVGHAEQEAPQRWKRRGGGGAQGGGNQPTGWKFGEGPPAGSKKVLL